MPRPDSVVRIVDGTVTFDLQTSITQNLSETWKKPFGAYDFTPRRRANARRRFLRCIICDHLVQNNGYKWAEFVQKVEILHTKNFS
jgi:hypothetical protein